MCVRNISIELLTRHVEAFKDHVAWISFSPIDGGKSSLVAQSSQSFICFALSFGCHFCSSIFLFSLHSLFFVGAHWAHWSSNEQFNRVRLGVRENAWPYTKRRRCFWLASFMKFGGKLDFNSPSRRWLVRIEPWTRCFDGNMCSSAFSSCFRVLSPVPSGCLDVSYPHCDVSGYTRSRRFSSQWHNAQCDR